MFELPPMDKLFVNASMISVLLLAWLCYKLKLGFDVQISTEGEARRLAREALCDFAATDLALDRAGTGALLRDGRGRIMLLRRQGARFVARLLDRHANSQHDRNFLTIGTGEAPFGKVTLDLGDKAQIWADSVRSLKS